MKIKKQETTFGWHFVGAKLRDGSPIPRDGVWLPKLEGKIIPCQYGYHGSKHPFDALKYAPGSTLCYCEYRGHIVEHGDPVDKFAAPERRIIRRMDAAEMLSWFARMQALSVVHLWDAPDVVLDWLMTGDESLRTFAFAHAHATTAAAAAYATTTTTAAAAYATEIRVARAEFAALVYECFGLEQEGQP